ncbi:hypothetical protein DSO57_1036221 [Entomophthora muscae]|uniref:Uncharacterized protein n=1 Tax=Entomophthora muscae TaxID=34485 RepID=A0ACC2S1F9_9FUNG|nr:hypothetical protein DSO57_1036221 [Entomophthora muscae]
MEAMISLNSPHQNKQRKHIYLSSPSAESLVCKPHAIKSRSATPSPGKSPLKLSPSPLPSHRQNISQPALAYHTQQLSVPVCVTPRQTSPTHQRQTRATKPTEQSYVERQQLFEQLRRILHPREKELLPKQIALMAEFFFIHRTSLAAGLFSSLPLFVQVAAPTEFKFYVHTLAAAAALPAPNRAPAHHTLAKDAALHYQIALHLQSHIATATTQSNLELPLRLLSLLESTAIFK